MRKPYDPKALKFEWLRIIAAARLGANTTYVASMLGGHANKDGTKARPGVRLLAHETELSERTVRRSLEHLRGLGLIRRTVRGSRAEYRNWADEYLLVIPDDLEDRVEIQEKPTERNKSQGRGGMANHVRWHERRGLTDPKCVHCSGGWEGLMNTSGGPPEGLTEGSVNPSRKGSDPIRPPVRRTPISGQTDADHRSQGMHHQSCTTNHVNHYPAPSGAAARASSRGPKMPSFEAFYRRQWPEHVDPGEKLTEEDGDYVYDLIGREYIEDLLGDLDAVEETTVNGMLSNAAHPKMIVNKILDMRGEVA